MSSGITRKTEKIIWGRAGGRCSICNTPLHPNGDNGAIVTGEMAHIIAKNQGGPRSERLLIGGDINGYENLILLCPNHHTEVDKNEKYYTPERLREIKKNHEALLQQSQPPTNNQSIMITDALNAFMSTFNFRGIGPLINKLPENFKLEWLDNKNMINLFYESFPDCQPFPNPTLEKYFTSFYQSIVNLCEYITSLSNKGDYKEFPLDHCMRLSNCLDLENRENIENRVRKITIDILESHDQLLKYIQQQYPEVNFGRYRP